MRSRGDRRAFAQAESMRDSIVERLGHINQDAEKLFGEAEELVSQQLSDHLVFQLTDASSEAKDSDRWLNAYGRAQCLCFVANYESLPETHELKVVQAKNGMFYPDNANTHRHHLHEYRQVVHNAKDATHYSNVHSFCRRILRKDPASGLSVAVYDGNDVDGKDRNITSDFIVYLGQRINAIRYVKDRCDFAYLYNGILQHSEQRYADRYIDDYSSGELHYVFLQHAMACTYMKKSLWWHYALMRRLCHATMGPL